MALSKTVLSASIRTKILAIPGIVISSPTELQNFTDAISEAIVLHIQSAAVVTSTIVSGSIATAGGPSNQVGPPAPVIVTGSIT